VVSSECRLIMDGCSKKVKFSLLKLTSYSSGITCCDVICDAPDALVGSTYIRIHQLVDRFLISSFIPKLSYTFACMNNYHNATLYPYSNNCLCFPLTFVSVTRKCCFESRYIATCVTCSLLWLHAAMHTCIEIRTPLALEKANDYSCQNFTEIPAAEQLRRR